MKYYFLVFCLVAVFTERGMAQKSITQQPTNEQHAHDSEDAFSKPIYAMVQWMTINLQLSSQQEKELLDFYLSTPIVFNSMDDSYPDPKKEESLAQQEAKLKEVLSAAQLQEFLQRGDEVQSVIMQNLPK